MIYVPLYGTLCRVFSIVNIALIHKNTFFISAFQIDLNNYEVPITIVVSFAKLQKKSCLTP